MKNIEGLYLRQGWLFATGVFHMPSGETKHARFTVAKAGLSPDTTRPRSDNVSKMSGFKGKTSKTSMGSKGRMEVEKATQTVLSVDFETLNLSPDPLYKSGLVGMFVQRVMKHGKKQKAYRLTYAMLERLRQKTQQDPVMVLEKAVQNVMPAMEVKPRRVGGSTYQVPYDVQPERGTVLAVRWILKAVHQRGGVGSVRKMEDEIHNAFKGSGVAMKRRDDEHRSAESNRAFIRYRVGQRNVRGGKKLLGRQNVTQKTTSKRRSNVKPTMSSPKPNMEVV